jgi:hypothetical protein
MRLALVIAVLALGAGCAAVPSDAASGLAQPDSARMSAIESQAARYGTRVYWINPPQKPASRDARNPREGT